MIFLLIGLGCIVSSLFSQNKVIMYFLSSLCFLLYFQVVSWTGQSLAFNQSYLVVFLMFILGIYLLVLELYVPDFGISGIMGFIMMILSLYFHTGDWGQVVLITLAALLVVFLCFVLFIKSGKELSLSSAFVLDIQLNKQEGYSSHEDRGDLLGQVGHVVMDLRPVGRGQFNQESYEVVSLEGFIAKGNLIKVIRISNGSIYVIKEESVDA